MNKTTRSVLIWFVAFLITLVFSVFQRITGPTNSIMRSEVFDDLRVSYRFLRSYVSGQDLPVKIRINKDDISFFLDYKRVNSSDSWGDNVTEIIKNTEGRWVAYIHTQPIAGKVEYKVFFKKEGKDIYLNDGKSIVARFKGDVPAYFLIPHIFFMFLSIFLTVRLGIELFFKEGKYFKLVNITVICFVIGAGILGPLVQYHAFGDAWTGLPWGTDLTDNKSLLAMVFWALAFFLKKKKKIWVTMAVVVMLLVYLIPHSLLGSELDYESGSMKNKLGYINIKGQEVAQIPFGKFRQGICFNLTI